MNDTPAAPGPTPGPATRPDRDHRPGLRTLLVPRLLSQGLTPAQAARTTHVPAPLVTLIADHEPDERVPSRRPTSRPQGPHPSRLLPMRGRRNAARARALFVGAITAGCTGSILWHEPLLPIVLVVTGSLAGNSLRDRAPAGRRHAPRN
jgi:hypothetical protein